MSPLILFLVFLVAWLTAAATAVRSVSRIWLRHWVERKLAGIASGEIFVARPPRLLLAAGTGIAALTMTIGVTAAVEAESGLSLVRTLAVSALLLLVFGQSVPRAIARRWGMELVPLLLPVLHALGLLVSPVLEIGRASCRERV